MDRQKFNDYFNQWLADGSWDLWDCDELSEEQVAESKVIQEAVQIVGMPTLPAFYTNLADLIQRVRRLENETSKKSS